MTTLLQTKIRDYLDRHGHSIAGFEREAGLKINVLRNIVTGQSLKPTVSTLTAIAKAMNCSVPYLLGKEDEPAKKVLPGSAVITNKKLLMESLEAILKVAEGLGKTLTVYQSSRMLDEIYAYMLQKNPPSLDQDFITWFVTKELNSDEKDQTSKR